MMKPLLLLLLLFLGSSQYSIASIERLIISGEIDTDEPGAPDSWNLVGASFEVTVVYDSETAPSNVYFSDVPSVSLVSAEYLSQGATYSITGRPNGAADFEERLERQVLVTQNRNVPFGQQTDFFALGSNQLNFDNLSLMNVTSFFFNLESPTFYDGTGAGSSPQLDPGSLSLTRI